MKARLADKSYANTHFYHSVRSHQSILPKAMGHTTQGPSLRVRASTKTRGKQNDAFGRRAHHGHEHPEQVMNVYIKIKTLGKAL